MLGRLKSLPLTFVGAMGLGLLTSYFPGYVHARRVPRPGPERPSGAVPLRRGRGAAAGPAADRPGQGHRLARRCRRCRGRWAGAPGSCCSWRCWPARCPRPNLLLVGTAATFAIVMLSLVLLTGYGGHVSLAQLTFAGVGALTYAKLDEPNLYGLLVSVLVAAAVGALVALPVLRLTGLFLALATLAFASIMDKIIFQADLAFGFNGLLPAERLSLLGPHGRARPVATSFLMAVFLVVDRAGRCCCCAAASSAGCSSPCATAPLPAGRSASTCAGSGSACSRLSAGIAGLGRRAVRRAAPDHRRRRLHLLQQPSAAPLRRGLRASRR